MNNYARIIAIKKSNEKRLLKINKGLTNDSGIYFFLRVDENGIKYAYVGQALHILDRLCSHLSGYQHIDLSIKKHGLISDKHPYGWSVSCVKCSSQELDDKERYYIKMYADLGYQLRNKTIGGQNEGKVGIDDNKPSKGYYDGLSQGYKNCWNEVKEYFDKYLIYEIKEPKLNKKGKVFAIKQSKFDCFTKWLEKGK